MNMETTKNKSVVCSNCGGQIDVNTLDENVECPYCGTKYSVSDLLNESDAVRIEKIKTNAQQKMEKEKLEQEREQNKNQEEKNEIEKFKKGKFSKVLLVFFAISVLFFFVAKGFLPKLLTGIQAVGFIGAWLMGSKIIKEPMKGLHNILAIISFVLIFPIISTGGGQTSTKSEKIIWNDIAMHEVLPEPTKKSGRVLTNNEKDLSIYIDKSSREDFSKYVEACKGKGFTVESKKDTNSYDAYNSDGYKLRLYYYEYGKEYNIDLDAPMELKENAWVNTPLSQLVPEPDSKLGKVESNSEKYFTYYAGKTSKDTFSSYANSVLNAGFNKDYSSKDTYFYGTNVDGYKVNVSYEGNNIMKISITAPDNKAKTETTPAPTQTEQPKTETPAPTQTEQPKNETSKPTENKTSSHSGLGKEFKEAMDSYEAFIDEYCTFMKKYTKSNGTDMTLLADYAKYVSKLEDANKKFDKWEDEEMNAEETAYYIEVQTRVNKKLLEVAN